MEIKKIDCDFSVCKVEDYSQVKLTEEYCFIGKTDEENSLVCPTDSLPDNIIECESGWRAFRINEKLDFSLIGILSGISGILRDNNISIFAVSTYDTDYIFIKKENYIRALEILSDEGFEII